MLGSSNASARKPWYTGHPWCDVMLLCLHILQDYIPASDMPYSDIPNSSGTPRFQSIASGISQQSMDAEACLKQEIERLLHMAQVVLDLQILAINSAI